MLDKAFFESADFRTLIEGSDRCIVVGRRGTGKSALAYMLNRHFHVQKDWLVIAVAPDEADIIGVRPLLEPFGARFRLIRAAATICWRYGLLIEIASHLRFRHQFKKHAAFEFLNEHLQRWTIQGTSFVYRLSSAFRAATADQSNPETIVGDLARRLELSRIEEAVRSVLNDIGLECVILLDRLDEGYEPDDIGVGFIDGLTQTAIDIRDKFDNIRPIVFLRDNIYRALAQKDPDFSRTIEAQTIRLHWDEYALLNVTANRFREAFKIAQEQSIKVWDRAVASGLEGKEGFKKCLRLTLYRPRDLLILLNSSFFNAIKQDRERIVPEDIEASAKTISLHRLDDLRKEYTAILPTLPSLIERFAEGPAEMTVAYASERIAPLLTADNLSNDVKQHLAIVNTPRACLSELYSVGFLGIRNSANSNVVFCHDGREPAREFTDNQKVLVHPCYWIALNISARELDPNVSQDIYDEYEISISSETPKRRSSEIGGLIAELGNIPTGTNGAHDFEDWVHRALQIVFAGRLSNIQMKPNGAAIQRRDIVGTNLSASPFWRRVFEDHKSRQVIFEVKNYDELSIEDFRQALSYSGGEYGSCLFFVTRANNESLRKGHELDWVRELHSKHKLLTVKLGAKTLAGLLAKLRSPQKHDVSDKVMNGLFDTYTRMYLNTARSR